MNLPPIRSAIAAAFVLGIAWTGHASTNSFATLHTFNATNDGNVPYGALTEGADGNFYGTTSTGGKNSNGTVFSIEPNGSHFKVLNAFSGSNGASQSEAALIQADDGNFYGTTFAGGANTFGALFQITPSGKLAVLTSFQSGPAGENPAGALVQGANGLLYGTAEYGGIDNFGTVYSATTSGALLTTTTFEGGLDGANPQSDLILGADGNFYGTTSKGGTGNYGTFFQLTPGGTRTVLYNFTNGADGDLPLKGVIQGTDGSFYGITQIYGPLGGGVIYRIAVSGTSATLTPLYDFSALDSGGYNSYSVLTQASDGNFYGTTYEGGTNNSGTVFRMTPGGAYSVVYEFTNGSDGGYPIAGVTQGSDGRLYGTTAGQSGSSGAIFKINLGLSAPTPRIVTFAPTSALASNVIQLRGQHFVGTTAVTFAGASGPVAATSFTVASNTALSATVPSEAVTGLINVTANGVSSSSPAALTITGASPTPIPIEGVTVDVTAPDAVASFGGNNNGRFRISRTASDLSQPLTVLFKIGPASTAVRGTDYNLKAQGEILATVTNSVTIPAGAAIVSVRVVPIVPSTPQPDKKVVLKIKVGEGYTVGSTHAATVLIAGNGG